MRHDCVHLKCEDASPWHSDVFDHPNYKYSCKKFNKELRSHYYCDGCENYEAPKNVYFQHSDGKFSLLRENIAEKYVHLVINHFLAEHNFTSYYTRSWTKDGVTWYDVGSHTEFFIWASEEDYKKLLKETEE